MSKIKNKIILLILDGFGLAEPSKYNSFSEANPKFLNHLMQNFPMSKLKTHGSAVGLPEDQMGNSEVGHITIGSGRVIFGDLTKINNSIQNQELILNENLQKFLNTSKERGENSVHIAGLLSKGGVHSHEEHFFELIKICLAQKLKVYAHIFLDGRDVGTQEGYVSIERLLKSFSHEKNFSIASVIGRAFAMDRDKRFEKNKVSFDAIVSGSNFEKVNNSEDFEIAKSNEELLLSLKKSYAKNISDEYISPIIMESYPGAYENDSIIFVNWRADRMRQIASSLVFPNFSEFNREKFINQNKMDCNFFFKNAISMNEYSSEISANCASIFQKENLENTLGDVLEKNHLKQLRIAETEKYAHVTFFFDGGLQKEHENKKEILIDSPRHVKTYDLMPQMSAKFVKEKIIENLENFDIIIANFANLDMIGHTGSISACIKAFEFLDEYVQEIDQKISEKASQCDSISWNLIVTSDHGNAEEMVDKETLEIKTCHSKNLVPFIIKNYSNKDFHLKENGELRDIASTILDILNIVKPKEFSGESLIIKSESGL